MKSSHREVTCVACHVRPGIEGWLRDKAWAGTKDVAIYLFGTPTDPHNLQAKFDSVVCLSCHRNILRMSEVALRDLPPPVNEVGLVMSHRKHIEVFAKRGQGEGCTTCYSGVVHEQPIKVCPIVMPRGHRSLTTNRGTPTIRRARTYGQRLSRIAFDATTGRRSMRERS